MVKAAGKISLNIFSEETVGQSLFSRQGYSAPCGLETDHELESTLMKNQPNGSIRPGVVLYQG